MQYNQIHKKRIGGAGMVVEIDECHLHSRKYGVGRVESSELWWVFGGICRQTHEMFVVVVENRNQNTLSKAVFENIEKDSLYTATVGVATENSVKWVSALSTKQSTTP